MNPLDPDFEAQLVWPEFRWLYQYWQSKHVDDRLPARAAISPADFPALLPLANDGRTVDMMLGYLHPVVSARPDTLAPAR